MHAHDFIALIAPAAQASAIATGVPAARRAIARLLYPGWFPLEFAQVANGAVQWAIKG